MLSELLDDILKTVYELVIMTSDNHTIFVLFDSVE